MELDIRMWSREMITDLINLYKSFPCLWKIKSGSYKNKNQKEQAYQTLVQFCQSRGFSNATKDFVVRKIQSLRGSFRKELKKLETARREHGSGAQKTYEPSLWYFDLLLFTKDQESPTDSASTDSDDSASENPRNEPQAIFVDNDHKQRTTESPEESRESGSNVNEKRRFDTVPRSPVHYKKKRRVGCVQTEFLSACRESLKANSKPLSEYEALGINVARKLERMDRLQAIFAESLIGFVLRDGLLKKLNAESEICKGGCRNASHSSSKESQSTEMVTVYCIKPDNDNQEVIRNGK